jgi:hypothetical protein
MDKETMPASAGVVSSLPVTETVRRSEKIGLISGT